MINAQSEPAAVVNTVGPFERPCETEFGRDSTDCAQISPLLDTLDSIVLLANPTSSNVECRRHTSRQQEIMLRTVILQMTTSRQSAAAKPRDGFGAARSLDGGS